jgi:hypothetical protein
VEGKERLHATALALPGFSDLEKTGDAALKIEGELGRKYGFSWFTDDDIPTHTAGSGAGYLVKNDGGLATGTKVIPVNTGAGTILVGDMNRQHTAPAEPAQYQSTEYRIRYRSGVVVALVRIRRAGSTPDGWGFARQETTDDVRRSDGDGNDDDYALDSDRHGYAPNTRLPI